MVILNCVMELEGKNKSLLNENKNLNDIVQKLEEENKGNSIKKEEIDKEIKELKLTIENKEKEYNGKIQNYEKIKMLLFSD